MRMRERESEREGGGGERKKGQKKGEQSIDERQKRERTDADTVVV